MHAFDQEKKKKENTLSTNWLVRSEGKGRLTVIEQGFGSAFFFADPDPGENLHADPDPDPGGIRGRGLGGKGKNEFFLSFFHVSDDS